jgi:chromosome segregation ATPase
MALLVVVGIALYFRYAGMGDSSAAQGTGPAAVEQQLQAEHTRQALAEAETLLNRLKLQQLRGSSGTPPAAADLEKELHLLAALHTELAAATQAAEHRRSELTEGLSKLDASRAAVSAQNERMAQQLDRAHAEIARLEAELHAQKATPTDTRPAIPK